MIILCSRWNGEKSEEAMLLKVLGACEPTVFVECLAKLRIGIK